MFSTGSKLTLGFAAAATAGFVVYALTQSGGALGTAGLFFAILALGGLATAIIRAGDGDVSAMDAAAVATAPSGAQPAGSSMWPMVAAIGAAVTLVGVVTDKRYFVAGLAVILVAALEWMVRAWADRASSDAAHNQAVRRRLAHPLELPLAGLAGLAVVIFGFSRVMVATDKVVGPIVFSVGAALILGFGTLFSVKPGLRRSLVTGVCALGGVVVLAGGIATAAVGERHQLTEAYEEDHFGSREWGHRECEAEVGESDHKASETVALKSNVLAEMIFNGSTLELALIDGEVDPHTLTINRGETVSVLFRNHGQGEHRLSVLAGYETNESTGTRTANHFCTRAIPEDGTQILTFKMAKPTVEGDENYTYHAEVPGVEGAEIEIVVP